MVIRSLNLTWGGQSGEGEGEGEVEGGKGECDCEGGEGYVKEGEGGVQLQELCTFRVTRRETVSTL